MRKIRFYSDQPLALDAEIKLSDSAATHAVRVLRMTEGDTATLFNGDGADYQCELISVNKNAVLAKVIDSQAIDNESPLNITLLQGISSGDRMDFTIQKAVELGINHIQPIATERSVVKLQGDRATKRTQHWQQIAISACEQSGRAMVPDVARPMTLAQWLSQRSHTNQTRLLLSPAGAQRLANLPKPEQAIVLLIGAEGGLSDHEIDLACQHGFQSIVLGPRILRTETAALTTLASIQTLWGDF